ncbi:MAG: biotin--[acetyl-CoA-carboxylase] ligase, partial [Oscillatoriales cyanobacterium SM2_2_1]|nr:biotin--[acetyl-CoA-carboxylase] ligase [Oscillatoriales cyanobacterium SM2_2_1]
MKCLFYDTVDSTNALAWRMIARREAEHGIVIIANQQTAGRGQFGRPWQAAPGGVYLSVVWQPPCPAAQSPLLTIAVAWGLAIALQGVGAAVRLKWLNDLILERRKLGGILTETRMLGDRLVYAVVGVGINWRNPVPVGAIGLDGGHHQVLGL